MQLLNLFLLTAVQTLPFLEITEATDSKIQIHGCLPDFQSNGYPIVNAVEKIEIDGEPKLIRSMKELILGKVTLCFVIPN